MIQGPPRLPMPCRAVRLDYNAITRSGEAAGMFLDLA